MVGLNRVQLIGNLGADPESRFTPGGSKVTSFRVAVTRRWRKDDTVQEATEWITVEAWGRTAEVCEQYLHKGSRVYVEGRLQTDRYEDKSGVTKYFTKVVAQQMQMLDRKQVEAPAMAVEEEEAVYVA